MQQSAADADAAAMREVGFDSAFVTDKTNSAKRAGVQTVEIEAKLAQGGDGVGHQALAAGLVNGRAKHVGNGDVKPLPAGRDGSGKSGGSTADDENIGSLGYG